MNEEAKNEQLIEDCKDIDVEHSFTSRWARIEGYHLLGLRILEDRKRFKTMEELVQLVGHGIGRKRSSIFYAVQFAQKFPDLDKLPEGKNTIWRNIVHKYLPPSKEEKPKREKTILCPKCGFEFNPKDCSNERTP